MSDLWNTEPRLTEQYADTSRLETRRAVWAPGPEGVSPVDVAVETVLALAPARVLEVGCGTGDLARAVCRALPDTDYVATDRSAAMTRATEEAAAAEGLPGLSVEQVDASALPYADGSFDVVVAAWMLYHLPDLGAGLREIARVLRPGGTLVAVTNSERSLATLHDAVLDWDGLAIPFSSENGEAALRSAFATVARRDVESRATFPDHASAAAYLDTLVPRLGERLPWFEGPQEHAGAATVFTATAHWPPEPPINGGDLATMLGALERQRATFAWKSGGLDAAGLTARLGPSTMTLGGLVKHLALVEDFYFTYRLLGRDPAAPWNAVDFDADPDWEWRTAADDSPEELYALWQGAVGRSRATIAELLAAGGGLDSPWQVPPNDRDEPTLRRMLIDLIEEYARHVGHADLFRESVDGLVGEDPPRP